MSGKNSRHPSPSTPPTPHHTSKLPKFFHRSNRDRSSSNSGEPSSSSAASIASLASASSAGTATVTAIPTPTPSSPPPEAPSTPSSSSKHLRRSRLLGSRDPEKDDRRKSVPPASQSPGESRTVATPPPPTPPPQGEGPNANAHANANSTEVDEPPVIVEPVPVPVAIPRIRTRSDRPLSTASEMVHSRSLYSSPTTSRISDLPTRISGWFNHTFSSSTNDLSLPNLLSQSHSQSSTSSPKAKLPASFLTAIPGRAVRYIFDTDATPDKCTDPIWLLGVQHPGYEPPPPAPPPIPPSSNQSFSSKLSSSTSFSGGRRNSRSPPSVRSSTLSLSASSINSSSSHDPVAGHHYLGSNRPGWPPAFYADFVSRIWLTYRSHFPPIRDGRLKDLACVVGDAASMRSVAVGGTGGGDAASVRETSSPVTAMRARAWPWSGGSGAEKGLTSDSGWGCMLRTGQSLLANALLHLHLGRDWRRPPYPVYTVDYATYVQILTWFLDSPSVEAPFSVHRMALAGKELGKDVGQWFGPSTAAGAIKTLVHAFPECGIGVAVATDIGLYQTDVYTASHGGSTHARSPRKLVRATWGDRPVLLLLGIRLGIDRVNPIYYDTIKQLYTFPQSVGIAGGRPGSSYYFVGAQANNLFYLDPHQSRYAIPLRQVPTSSSHAAGHSSSRDREGERESTPESDREFGVYRSKSKKLARSSSQRQRHQRHQQQQQRQQQQQQQQQQQHPRIPTSPSSIRTGSSTFSYHAPTSPSPLQHQYSTSSTGSSSQQHHSQSYSYSHPPSRSPPPSSHARWHSQIESQSGNVSVSSEMDPRELMGSGSDSRGSGSGSGSGGSGVSGGGYGGYSSSAADSLVGGLDTVQQHYATAYSAAELKTFHCEQVRKMPMSGLDPSMLIGFLCRDEREWVDFRRRVAELPRTIFSIQDEPPSWPSDSDDNMGFESISDPDDIEVDMASDDEEDEGVEDVDEEGSPKVKVAEENEGDSDQYFDTRSRSSAEASPVGMKRDGGSGGEEKSDTEEDPVDPVTPGPGSRFVINQPPPPPSPSDGGGGSSGSMSGEDDGDNDGDGDDDDDDDDDEWVDPSSPTSCAVASVLTKEDSQSPVIVESPSSFPASASSSSPSLPFGAVSAGAGNGIGGGTTMVVGGGKRSSRKKGGPGLVPVMRPLPAMSPSKSRRSGREGKRKEVFEVAEREQEQEHYPFPAAEEDDEYATPLERSRNNTSVGVGGDEAMVLVGGKRMNHARGRDGGRTQSGGVKVILTDQ
ncbi:hypothetical protein AX17_006925 [Amanita inopinata Kibby_2008]|nr:hypothetical protein AX17_006925 [Amanita inopinata Kibby_2008]